MYYYYYCRDVGTYHRQNIVIIIIIIIGWSVRWPSATWRANDPKRIRARGPHRKRTAPAPVRPGGLYAHFRSHPVSQITVCGTVFAAQRLAARTRARYARYNIIYRGTYIPNKM